MEKDPFKILIELFDSKKIEYELHEHEPAITVKEALKVRHTDALGLKSLLFKADNENVLLILPGERKVSSKKVRSFIGVKDVRMVSPEEVFSIMGCEIGGCYPVGSVCGLRTIMDRSIEGADRIVFNAGRRDRSVEMRWMDLKKLFPFEIGELS